MPFINEAAQNYNFFDKNPFLAGWGMTRENGERSHVLMQVQVPVVNNKDCKETYRRHDRFESEIQFDDRVVCTGFENGGKGSAKGDSGGPLMLPIHQNSTFPFYQIGIVSYSEGTALPNIPSVNTNVQFYAKWIKKKLNE